MNAVRVRKGNHCQEPGCGKHASFGVLGSRASHCGPHGKPLNLVDVVSPNCIHPGCNKKPSFGIKGSKKGTHCKSHAEPLNLVPVHCCAHPGCGTQPKYGVIGTKKMTHCVKHGRPLNLVDLFSARCAHPGCGKQPTYGVAGTRKATCCAPHGRLLNLVNVISVRCAHPGCDVQPSFGVLGTKATYCKGHGLPLNLVNVISVLCAHAGCKMHAYYGVEGTKKYTHCRRHGLQLNLVDVLTSRCAHPGCDSQRKFGVAGTKAVTHCGLHGRPLGLVDIVSPRCVQCKDVQAQMKKYRGHCQRCFVHLFPEEAAKITRNVKVKEQHFIDFLMTADLHLPPGVQLRIDRRIDEPCVSLRRPDVYVGLGIFALDLECDENRHSGYSCENKRTMQLFDDGQRIPLVQLRFNPDAYTDADGKKHPSCFKEHKANGVLLVIRNKFEARMTEYVEAIRRYAGMAVRGELPTKEVTIEEYFYTSANLI